MAVAGDQKKTSTPVMYFQLLHISYSFSFKIFKIIRVIFKILESNVCMFKFQDCLIMW